MVDWECQCELGATFLEGQVTFPSPVVSGAGQTLHFSKHLAEVGSVAEQAFFLFELREV